MPTRDELREWSAALTPRPLDVSEPIGQKRYVELAEAGRGAVNELQATIELSMDTTTQLLSGPPGSGKSTELYRLRRELRAEGFRADVVDIQAYLNTSSPVDVTEFLIAVAVGAHDVLAPQLPDPQRPGFARRLWAMLRRLDLTVEIAGVTASASADSVEVGGFGASASVDLSRELKSNQPLVEEFRDKLSYHLPELYSEVAEFLRELLNENEDLGQGAVLIVDGLERLQGTMSNEQQVQQSVESLFVQHAGELRFRSHHLVYTVPTYLQFTAPGALPYDRRPFVPVPHLRPQAGGTDAAAEQNLCELREVVRRRIPVDRIFPSADLLDAVIRASGGHLRDLFVILQVLVRLMRQMHLSLPVEPSHVEEAIREVARPFAAMTAEQAQFLRAVATGDGIVQPSAADVPLMAKLLQSHMLLGHSNGVDWYEVHPLTRRALGVE